MHVDGFVKSPTAARVTCHGSVCNCKVLCKAYYSGLANGVRTRSRSRVRL
jgi:hypothetical protein